MKNNILFAALVCILVFCYPATSVSSVVAKKRCHIHGEVLKKVNVPIVYGLVIEIVEPEARKELFPYSNVRVLGGCDLGESDPTEAEVYYCYQCRVAEYKFKKALLEYEQKNQKNQKLLESGWWRGRNLTTH